MLDLKFKINGLFEFSKGPSHADKLHVCKFNLILLAHLSSSFLSTGDTLRMRPLEVPANSTEWTRWSNPFSTTDVVQGHFFVPGCSDLNTPEAG